jgi:hypothetical protein
MMDDIDARTGLKRVLMHHLLEGIIIGKDLWFDGGSGSIVALGDGSEGGGKKKKSWGTVEGSDVRVIKEGDR